MGNLEDRFLLAAVMLLVILLFSVATAADTTATAANTIMDTGIFTTGYLQSCKTGQGGACGKVCIKAKSWCDGKLTINGDLVGVGVGNDDPKYGIGASITLADEHHGINAGFAYMSGDYKLSWDLTYIVLKL